MSTHHCEHCGMTCGQKTKPSDQEKEIISQKSLEKSIRIDPRIFSFDVYKEEPPKTNIAYCDIDIGSVATDKNIRLDLFSYAWDYTITGGYILINNSVLDEFKKKHPLSIQNSEIKKLNEFNNSELWKNPHQNRLNTKTLIKKL